MELLIRDIEIPLPSLEKQHEIVDKLVLAFIEIESLKRRINTEMEFSSSLRKSLLSNSFTQKEVFA